MIFNTRKGEGNRFRVPGIVFDTRGEWGDCVAEGKIGLRLALKVVTDNAIAIFIPIECRLIVFYTFSRYTNP